jgi:hypothetical protein
LTGTAIASTLSSSNLVIADPATTATYGNSSAIMSNPLQTTTMSLGSISVQELDSVGTLHETATLTPASLVITNTLNNTTLTDGAISMTNGEFKTNVQSFEYIELNDNSNLSSASMIAGSITVRSNPVITATLSSTSLDMSSLGVGTASFSQASGLAFASSSTTQSSAFAAEQISSVFPSMP